MRNSHIPGPLRVGRACKCNLLIHLSVKLHHDVIFKIKTYYTYSFFIGLGCLRQARATPPSYHRFLKLGMLTKVLIFISNEIERYGRYCIAGNTIFFQVIGQ